MAATPISMPRLGMSMEEGRVVEWRIPIGHRIEKGEILLVIESEKSEVEIEAVAAGHLRHIYVELDETVPCGSLLAVLTEQLDEPFDAEALAAELAPRESETSAQNRAVAVPEPPASKESNPVRPEAARPTREEAHARRPVAPAARAIARKLGVPIDAVPGTGPGRRVTREDVEAWTESGGARVEVGEGILDARPSKFADRLALGQGGQGAQRVEAARVAGRRLNRGDVVERRFVRRLRRLRRHVSHVGQGGHGIVRGQIYMMQKVWRFSAMSCENPALKILP